MSFVHNVWSPARPEATLIALHGHGAHCQDLAPLAPLLCEGRLRVICPQAEFRLDMGGWAPQAAYTWFERGPDDKPLAGELTRVAASLLEFIDDRLAAEGADLGRVGLAGFSQGGFLAYRLALAQPARWRCAAMLSTWLSAEAEGDAPEAASGLPLLVQHGSSDPLVGIERGRQSRDRLAELGLQADYREYPMQHEIGRESLHDLSAFLAAHLLDDQSA